MIDIVRRIHIGLRRPDNWAQLIRFGIVGSIGYTLNLIVFAGLLKGAHIHHLLAAVAAFVVAVTNNFWWNRHWTFGQHGAREDHAGFQAARFFAVSGVAFLFAAAMLELLVSVAGVPELGAQAISIAAATPLNFVGNKMWSFAVELRRE